ncbi:MAG: hypothetical protein U0871_04090 [Gemmataceae bacterium]
MPPQVQRLWGQGSTDGRLTKARKCSNYWKEVKIASLHERDRHMPKIVFLMATILVCGYTYYHIQSEGKPKPLDMNSVRFSRFVAEVERDAAIKKIETKGLSSYSLTSTDFNRIQPGMSYVQVCDALNRRGKLQAESMNPAGEYTESFIWTDGKAIITCSFHKDKLLAKAQAGL